MLVISLVRYPHCGGGNSENGLQGKQQIIAIPFINKSQKELRSYVIFIEMHESIGKKD